MLKRAVFWLSGGCGLNAAVRWSMRRRLLTLCYHSVLPDADIRPARIYRNVVGVGELRGQLETLGRWFAFASPDDVLRAAEGVALRRPSVLITFDDGHESLLAHAVPVLERVGAPAIFLLSTGHIGTGVPLWTEELEWLVSGWPHPRLPWPDAEVDLPMPAAPAERATLARVVNEACKRVSDDRRLAYLRRLRAGSSAGPPAEERDAFRFLDWDGVRALVRRGFTVGSHTVHHRILSRIDPETLDRELRDSRAQLERELGVPCAWIAYPNGTVRDVSPLVFERARAAGYRAGFTTTDGFAHPDRSPLAIGRLCVPGRLPREVFAAMVSGVDRWAARLPRLRREPSAT